MLITLFGHRRIQIFDPSAVFKLPAMDVRRPVRGLNSFYQVGEYGCLNFTLLGPLGTLRRLRLENLLLPVVSDGQNGSFERFGSFE